MSYFCIFKIITVTRYYNMIMQLNEINVRADQKTKCN